MTFLPILQRELRVRARSRANYWARFGVGLAALLLALPPLLSWTHYASGPVVGRSLFDGLIGAAFLLSCAACLVTADAVSSEARAGTLDLLLLTRVRMFDVLSGKFASSALAAFFALMAFWPVLSLPVLVGGVTGGEALRKGLTLAATLFLALSVGLWASTRSRDRFQTGRIAVLLMLAALLVPLLLSVVLPGHGLELAGPPGTLSAAGDLAYKAARGRFWLSLGIVCLLSCLLLFAASVALRRGVPENQRAADIVLVDASTNCLSASEGGNLGFAVTAVHNPRTPVLKPLQWLLARQRGLKLLFWLAAVVTFFLQLVFYWPLVRFLPLRSTPLWSWSLSLVGGGLTTALLAWGASRFLIEARRSGELELLLTTPRGARELVSAQWAVLKGLVVWPVVLMVFPPLLQGLVYLYFGWLGGPAYFRFSFGISSLLGVVNLVVSVGAACWLGMWFGLRGAGQAQAILWTVALVRAVPFCLNLLCSLLWNQLFGPLYRGSSSPYAFVATLGPQVLTLALLMFLLRFARRQLSGDLARAEPFSLKTCWRRV